MPETTIEDGYGVASPESGIVIDVELVNAADGAATLRRSGLAGLTCRLCARMPVDEAATAIKTKAHPRAMRVAMKKVLVISFPR